MSQARTAGGRAASRERWIVDHSMLDLVMSRRNLSSASLARSANVSESLVRNLRNGHHSGTTGATLYALCLKLGVAPEVVASRSGEAA